MVGLVIGFLVLLSCLTSASIVRADEYDKIIREALEDIEKASEELRNEIINVDKSSGEVSTSSQNQEVLPPVSVPPLISEFPGTLVVSDNIIESLEFSEIPVRDLLTMIAFRSAKAIEIVGNVEQKLTLSLRNVDVKDAVVIIAESANLAFKEESGSLKVMTRESFQSREGHPYVSGQQTKAIKLQYAEPDQVVSALGKIKNPSGRVFFNESSRILTMLDSEKMIEAMAEYVKRVDVKVESQVFTLFHRKVDAFAAELNTLLTADVGFFKVDASTNSVTVTDTVGKLNEIQNLINAWDRADAAIELQIRILQVMLNEENRMGIDWEAIVSDFQREAFPGFMYDHPSGSKNYLSLGTLSEEDYQVLLDALDTVGVINTVSPLQTQKINPGEPHTIALRSDQLSTMGGEDVSHQSDPEIDFVVRADLVSKEKGKKFVQLRVEPKLLLGTIEPVASNLKEAEELKTEFPLNQTLVVGGLFKDVMVESTRKIPFLGDLPILGFAFRNQGESLQRTEVIIFITPKEDVSSEGQK